MFRKASSVSADIAAAALIPDGLAAAALAAATLAKAFEDWCKVALLECELSALAAAAKGPPKIVCTNSFRFLLRRSEMKLAGYYGYYGLCFLSNA